MVKIARGFSLIIGCLLVTAPLFAIGGGGGGWKLINGRRVFVKPSAPFGANVVKPAFNTSLMNPNTFSKVAATAARSSAVVTPVPEIPLPVAVPRAEELDPVAHFHQLGNEFAPETSLHGDPYRRDADLAWRLSLPSSEQRPVPMRSMESLELQGSAEGILPENARWVWGEFSRDQLENLVTTVEQARAMNERTTVAVRAQLQPDNFIKSRYTEPWNEQVESLHILMVNDVYSLVEKFVKAAQEDGRVTVDVVYDVAQAKARLREAPGKYDIVFTDFHLKDGVGADITEDIIKRGEQTPVILFSCAGGTAQYWFSRGMTGRIEQHQSAQAVFNYASNVVATGKAFPNK